MAIINPIASPALGRTSTVIALTLANPAAPSIAGDLTAANSLNISCYLYAEGSARGMAEEEVGNAPRRACDTSQLQQFGNKTFTAPTLHYLHDPQSDDTAEANEARAMLTEGISTYALTRDGKLAKIDELIAGDLVTVHHIRLGFQNRQRTGDDAFGEFSILQRTVYVVEPTHDVAIVA